MGLNAFNDKGRIMLNSRCLWPTWVLGRGIGISCVENFLGLYIPFFWVIWLRKRWRRGRSLAICIHFFGLSSRTVKYGKAKPRRSDGAELHSLYCLLQGELLSIASIYLTAWGWYTTIVQSEEKKFGPDMNLKYTLYIVCGVIDVLLNLPRAKLLPYP